MGQNILVVDDDEQIRSVIETSLKRAQFSVYTCASAKETLSLSLDQFDLMIFDVMMPDMDGFELCRNVREKSRLSNIISYSQIHRSRCR